MWLLYKRKYEMNAKIRLASIVLAVLGITVSAYLTAYHYFSSIPLACSTKGLINCANVLHSKYAMLMGLPVAAFGVIFFVIELSLLYINRDEPLFIFNALGIGFVIYLLYAELMVGNICEYCTSVHIIVAILFILSTYSISHQS